jgi:hypothetical protein
MGAATLLSVLLLPWPVYALSTAQADSVRVPWLIVGGGIHARGAHRHTTARRRCDNGAMHRGPRAGVIIQVEEPDRLHRDGLSAFISGVSFGFVGEFLTEVWQRSH